MIYKKEPITNRIVKFQNEASIGAFFANWTRANESEVLAYELEQAKASKIAQCQAYLLSTDGDIIAHMKYGYPFDPNIAIKAKQAQDSKALIRACTTLEELNKINTNF